MGQVVQRIIFPEEASRHVVTNVLTGRPCPGVAILYREIGWVAAVIVFQRDVADGVLFTAQTLSGSLKPVEHAEIRDESIRHINVIRVNERAEQRRVIVRIFRTDNPQGRDHRHLVWILNINVNNAVLLSATGVQCLVGNPDLVGGFVGTQPGYGWSVGDGVLGHLVSVATVSRGRHVIVEIKSGRNRHIAFHIMDRVAWADLWDRGGIYRLRREIDKRITADLK